MDIESFGITLLVVLLACLVFGYIGFKLGVIKDDVEDWKVIAYVCSWGMFGALVSRLDWIWMLA